MGRTLGNSLVNLGLLDDVRAGAARARLRARGPARGGVGRRARQRRPGAARRLLPRLAGHAGATLLRLRPALRLRHLPSAHRQRRQVEIPDAWLRYGNPWEIARPDDRFRVQFYGRVHQYVNDAGAPRHRVGRHRRRAGDALRHADPRLPERHRQHAAPVGGQGDRRVRPRATSTRATTIGAVEAKARSENISKVLYPNDNIFEGKELRLEQEYFFVSATLQDIIRRYKKRCEMFDEAQGLPVFDRFADKVAIQLNDTHPALAIPELMRLLVDVEELDWDDGLGHHHADLRPTPTTPSCPRRSSAGRWACSAACCRAICRSSTRSTTASSTRSRQRFPDDDERCRRMSIIEEGGEQRVRMAHLAIVGSHSVNGVAALHTRDPQGRASSATSTSCGRRSSTTRPTASPSAAGCSRANPALSRPHHRGHRRRLGHRPVPARASSSPLADDAPSRDQWRKAKRENKLRLAEIIASQYEHRGHRRSRSIPTRSSTSRSSASTSTSASS